MNTRTTIATALALTCGSALAQKTPGYNEKIPAEIMTPDKVETSIGTLNFADGIPDAETTQKLYDNLDTLRAVETFLNFVPATSLEGLRLGQISRGATECNQVLIFEDLLDSNPLFLTGNTETVYCIGLLDLEKDGPTVVEIPPGCGPGTCDDAFFRFVIDMGLPGPDRGEGGKYLIVPPGYEGEVPNDTTIDKLYDNLDRMRGVEVYLNHSGAGSLNAMRKGNASIGVTAANMVPISEQLLKSESLYPMAGSSTAMPPSRPVGSARQATAGPSRSAAALARSSPSASSRQAPRSKASTTPSGPTTLRNGASTSSSPCSSLNH